MSKATDFYDIPVPALICNSRSAVIAINKAAEEKLTKYSDGELLFDYMDAEDILKYEFSAIADYDTAQSFSFKLNDFMGYNSAIVFFNRIDSFSFAVVFLIGNEKSKSIVEEFEYSRESFINDLISSSVINDCFIDSIHDTFLYDINQTIRMVSEKLQTECPLFQNEIRIHSEEEQIIENHDPYGLINIVTLALLFAAESAFLSPIDLSVGKSDGNVCIAISAEIKNHRITESPKSKVFLDLCRFEAKNDGWDIEQICDSGSISMKIKKAYAFPSIQSVDFKSFDWKKVVSSTIDDAISRIVSLLQ